MTTEKVVDSFLKKIIDKDTNIRLEGEREIKSNCLKWANNVKK